MNIKIGKLLASEILIEKLGHDNLSVFSTVLGLNLYYSDLDSPSKCTMVLKLRTGANCPVQAIVELTFSGVTELRIRNFGGPITQVIGLVLIDIADRQLEGLLNNVADYENDVINFYCASAEVNYVNVI